MSDEVEYDEDGNPIEEVEDKTATLPRSQVRSLEKKAKRADQAEEEAASARRELAFLKAKIDTDSPVGKLFVKSYDGDLEVEAIQSAWSELAGTSATETTAGEVASTDERAALASGAASDTGVEPKKPVRGFEGTAVQAGFEARNQHGAPWDDASGVTFSELVGAAMEGDESVIYRGEPE